jgi:hypothetical protein
MISRIWHGWTTHENADKYERLLRAEVLPGIHRKDYERAVIAPGASQLLSHYDERSQHYETLLTPSDVRAMAARTSGRNPII